MQRQMWSKGGALLMAGLVSTGCYNYVPTQVEAAPPGEEVRLHVTRDGARELAEVTDVVGAVPEVRGRVIGRDQSDLLLRVPVVQRWEGMSNSGLGQTIRVPTDEILSVERRELDGVMTAVLVTGGVAAATAVLLGVIEAFGRPSSNPDGPDPDFFLGLFSIPIG